MTAEDTKVNTSIHMHLRVLFASPLDPFGCEMKPIEARYVATKEVELLKLPKKGDTIQDGPLKMELYSVTHSVSGPRFVCEADNGYSYGWNDMGGCPSYYCLPADALWFTLCERLGWTLQLRGIGQLNERYPDHDTYLIAWKARNKATGGTG